MSSLKAFLLGLVVGIAVATGTCLLFGDSVRDRLSDTTRDVGQSVERAGEKLQEAGDRLK